MLRLSARRQRLAVKAGSVLVLLLAVAPQVLYLGQPLNAQNPPAAASRTGHQHQDDVAARHANHCHFGPKSCAGADGVFAAALGSNLTSALPQDGSAWAIESADPVRTFAVYQRPDKPPRAA